MNDFLFGSAIGTGIGFGVLVGGYLLWRFWRSHPRVALGVGAVTLGIALVVSVGVVRHRRAELRECRNQVNLSVASSRFDRYDAKDLGLDSKLMTAYKSGLIRECDYRGQTYYEWKY